MLALVAMGRDNAQIADALVISQATQRKHLERIYTKLGVHTRTEVVARAHGAPAPESGHSLCPIAEALSPGHLSAIQAERGPGC